MISFIAKKSLVLGAVLNGVKINYTLVKLTRFSKLIWRSLKRYIANTQKERIVL